MLLETLPAAAAAASAALAWMLLAGAPEQLVKQAIGVGVTLVFAGGGTWLIATAVRPESWSTSADSRCASAWRTAHRSRSGVNDAYVEPAIAAIAKAARTGNGEVGDGKIFVVPLEECVRIRTGERGVSAI